VSRTGFLIVRDPRGSLMHVRSASGECLGCVEVGLFEVVRAIVLEEAAAPAREGIPAEAAGGVPMLPREDRA
jgi:hypothetical protein